MKKPAKKKRENQPLDYRALESRATRCLTGLPEIPKYGTPVWREEKQYPSISCDPIRR